MVCSNILGVHNMASGLKHIALILSELVSELKADNDRYIIHLRAGIVAADQAGEPAVANFLQDLLGAHQKNAWMLSSIIK